MRTALDYFLELIYFNTTSNENSTTYPSSPGQIEILRHLAGLVEELELETTLSDKYTLYGRLPANSPELADLPPLGFIAHVDTSPAASGEVKSHRRVTYTGEPIVINAESNLTLSAALFPELDKLVGHDLIIADGTSLLGADNKAGIAEILALFTYLQANPQIKHGPLRLAFTPDEEIGAGTRYFDLELFDAAMAVTVDGGLCPEISCETFNAAGAVVTVRGRSVHPGTAYKQMVNAATLAARFAASFDPLDTPEETRERQGFLHCDNICGDVTTATINYIIRDFDIDSFAERKEQIRRRVEEFNARYARTDIDAPPPFSVEIKDQYLNMRSYIEREPTILRLLDRAFAAPEITPKLIPTRGGTDGARLSELGLPCPNVFTGGGNFHGPYEYLSVQDMERAVELLRQLVIAHADSVAL
ncbi:MAG: peptidase T [Clostridiaceae bacterium]|nr:peptidase T [Clostridiaceae bacterium]